MFIVQIRYLVPTREHSHWYELVSVHWLKNNEEGPTANMYNTEKDAGVFTPEELCELTALPRYGKDFVIHRIIEIKD